MIICDVCKDKASHRLTVVAHTRLVADEQAGGKLDEVLKYDLCGKCHATHFVKLKRAVQGALEVPKAAGKPAAVTDFHRELAKAAYPEEPSVEDLLN